MTMSDALAGADFRVLPPALRTDVRASIAEGIDAGAAFGCSETPSAVFRQAIEAALAADESRLGFLLSGVEADGSHSDFEGCTVEQYASAVRLAVSRIVTALQGALAELLAIGPCCQLLRECQVAGHIDAGARLYFGDSVLVPRRDGSMAKAADLHILTQDPSSGVLEVVGVGEIKSYLCSRSRIRRQLDKHLARLREGHASLAAVSAHKRALHAVRVAREPLRVTVLPASWHLPRDYEIVRTHSESQLLGRSRRPEPAAFVGGSAADWDVILGWSHEALAEAAFGILHRQLGRIGATTYGPSRPSPWPELTAEESGRHAAVMMLYYALLQRLSPRMERQLAKLYNVLGFGYALGANFRGPDGKIRMLWAVDLDEIARDGRTRDGSRIVP
jgi:hypothetical protein